MPLLWLLASAAAGEGEAKSVVREYKLSIVSTTTLASAETEKKSEADTDLVFHTVQTGNKVAYGCRSLFVRTRMDGQEIQYADMAEEKYIVKDRDGNTVETDIKSAPAELKEMLKDYFTTPIATLTVDAQGKETAREVSDKPNLKPLIHNGMFANMCLFVSSYGSEPTWKEAKEMSLGKGGFAKGEFTFTKVAAGKDNAHPGRVDVKVQGALAADVYKLANGTSIHKARFEIAGMQTWDAELRCWIAGDLGVRVEYEVHEGDKTLFTASGKVIASLALTRPKP
ncbi:MAG: hypothetical protein KIS92_00175 [Planctomycetota bacterium]|nr:hypothetical protein [Planctomycetota bacterium]